MPTINIFCKASFKHGLGHLIRQIHIANEFRRQNKEVYFYIKQKICAWCGKEALGFKSDAHLREYHQTGFCQTCQDDEEHQETKSKEELN